MSYVDEYGWVWSTRDSYDNHQKVIEDICRGLVSENRKD